MTRSDVENLWRSQMRRLQSPAGMERFIHYASAGAGLSARNILLLMGQTDHPMVPVFGRGGRVDSQSGQAMLYASADGRPDRQVFMFHLTEPVRDAAAPEAILRGIGVKPVSMPSRWAYQAVMALFRSACSTYAAKGESVQTPQAAGYAQMTACIAAERLGLDTQNPQMAVFTSVLMNPHYVRQAVTHDEGAFLSMLTQASTGGVTLERGVRAGIQLAMADFSREAPEQPAASQTDVQHSGEVR